MSAQIIPHPALAKRRQTSLSSYRAGRSRAGEDVFYQLEPDVTRWARHMATYSHEHRASFTQGYEDAWLEAMYGEGA